MPPIHSKPYRKQILWNSGDFLPKLLALTRQTCSPQAGVRVCHLTGLTNSAFPISLGNPDPVGPPSFPLHSTWQLWSQASFFVLMRYNLRIIEMQDLRFSTDAFRHVFTQSKTQNCLLFPRGPFMCLPSQSLLFCNSDHFPCHLEFLWRPPHWA